MPTTNPPLQTALRIPLGDGGYAEIATDDGKLSAKDCLVIIRYIHLTEMTMIRAASGWLTGETEYAYSEEPPRIKDVVWAGPVA